jgi:hypothetical protein
MGSEHEVLLVLGPRLPVLLVLARRAPVDDSRVLNSLSRTRKPCCDGGGAFYIRFCELTVSLPAEQWLTVLLQSVLSELVSFVRRMLIREVNAGSLPSGAVIIDHHAA